MTRFYATLETHPDYRRKDCDAHGCKLWRNYQSTSAELRCVDCACRKDGRFDPNSFDESGRRPCEEGSARRTDQIGWMVPAVPDEEGVGYWGYTSVPEDGVNWWRALPLRGSA